jgi:uncharacterized membrane protein
MSTTKNKGKILKLTQMAVLTAVIILMSFTPLGYLKIGAVEFSLLTIPVVIGAMTCGPLSGAVLGGVFGLTSFIQCFGMSPFGSALFGINPVYTFILCMVPRILVGWLAGLIFKALYRPDGKKVLPFAAASLSGALLNTTLFMIFLIILFGNSDYIMGIRGDLNVLKFAVALVGFNGLIEAGVCLVAGTLIAKALVRFIPVNKAEQTA